MLYHLGKAILNHESLAYKACLMYCINPASVFFSVAYSESMFAWITFTGMQRFDGNTRNGSFWFAVTTSIRANGLINMGYLWHRKLGEYIRLVPGLRGLSLKDKIMVGNVVFWMICTIPLVLYSILCIAPFLLVQYFAYTQFCTGNKADGIPQNILEYGTARGYTIMGVGPPPLWCKWTIPLSYSHVQNSHWDVGFLRYFEVKQVPNFLLASPMIVICMLTALRYISKNLKYSITLGLGRKSYIHKKSDASVPDLKDTGFDSEKCLPYVLHMLAMVIFGFFFMHIQVVTRFIASSCPVIYWYVAMVTSSQEELEEKQTNRYNIFAQVKDKQQSDLQEPEESAFDNLLTRQLRNIHNNSFSINLILLYFSIYFIIGTVLHCNFLPWT
ncbi:unnamed protein product [Owenia fusiformis]|uniref:GPI mannosyltransferase 2 n=1 Tax=Owenia fusiformis TaxID=6347 RepID=A0A8J1U007_OWEFU|nr:unnamed protein product [Owenia fusiformis]